MDEEAKLLKDEVNQKTNALQDVLGQVQSDIQDTKDKGLEEVKQMIIEEKEERQKEAGLIHDNLSCKINECSDLARDINDTLDTENKRRKKEAEDLKARLEREKKELQ